MSQLSNAGSAVRSSAARPKVRPTPRCLHRIIGVLLCVTMADAYYSAQNTEDCDPSEIRSHSQHWIRSCYKIETSSYIWLRLLPRNEFHQRPSDTLKRSECCTVRPQEHHCVADLLSIHKSRVSHRTSYRNMVQEVTIQKIFIANSMAPFYLLRTCRSLRTAGYHLPMPCSCQIMRCNASTLLSESLK